MAQGTFQVLADAVLVLHVGVVLFVVGGLAVVWIGNARRWGWVNALWFRLAHLAAIAVVVAQSWLGELCPLTTLESWLRVKGGSEGYASSFIEHWLHRILFYDIPFWVFTVAYTAFGLLVIAAWWRFPPRKSPGSS